MHLEREGATLDAVHDVSIQFKMVIVSVLQDKQQRQFGSSSKAEIVFCGESRAKVNDRGHLLPGNILEFSAETRLRRETARVINRSFIE